MIRLRTTFTDISADLIYDVLHDPVYRKVKYPAQLFFPLLQSTI